MEVTNELLSAAKKGRHDAIVQLLSIYYPNVWQMAIALTGRADVGRGVTRYVMRQSVRARTSWRDTAEPTRWFNHHTVLTVRRTVKHPADEQNDPLFFGNQPADSSYVAFIRALRALPVQQREAFILTHGHKLEFRNLAIAMDCSTVAATTHLNSATDSLRALAHDEYNSHVARMATIYQKLGPDEELSVEQLNQRIRGILMPWFVARTIKFILCLILLGAAIFGCFWLWRIVQHSMS